MFPTPTVSDRQHQPTALVEQLPESQRGCIRTPATTAKVASLTLWQSVVAFFALFVLLVLLPLLLGRGSAWIFHLSRDVRSAWIVVIMQAMIIYLVWRHSIGGWRIRSWSARFEFDQCMSAIRRRPESLVDADDPELRLIRVLESRKYELSLEHVADVGLLKIDRQNQQLLFEGDQRRYRIPAAAIDSCEVQTKGAGPGYLTLGIRVDGVPREILFYPAVLDFSSPFERVDDRDGRRFCAAIRSLRHGALATASFDEIDTIPPAPNELTNLLEPLPVHERGRIATRIMEFEAEYLGGRRFFGFLMMFIGVILVPNLRTLCTPFGIDSEPIMMAILVTFWPLLFIVHRFNGERNGLWTRQTELAQSKAVLQDRFDRVVNPDDPQCILVKIGRKGKYEIEHGRFVDTGFFRVDEAARELIFEGDNYRGRIAGEKIVACRVCHMLLQPSALLLTIRGRDGESLCQIPLFPRLTSNGRRLRWSDRHSAILLEQQVRAILPSVA